MRRRQEIQEKPANIGTAPAGAAQQETVDGVAEKESMVVTDADPTVTVCVYSVKSDKSGLKQNMDGIDGDELDAQELLDKMAEVGVIEEGITVDKFEQKDGALTLDLSSLKESSDKWLSWPLPIHLSRTTRQRRWS